jgi:Leu/Phe-tRNA-protein transferase
MGFYPLRYLPTGHIFIDPDDDCDQVVDAMLETDYSEEFCLARDFDEAFIDRLMEAGFLVMSTELRDETKNDEIGNEETEEADRFFILLPKLHLVRSALFFPELHIKKSVRRFLSRYELRVNTDFDLILDKCVTIHGAAWLTPPLVEILKSMRRHTRRGKSLVRPVSFALYRDGELKAGEIGVTIGRVYTSYSGYYEEDNAGTVQMILMAQWLDKIGFDFLDLGMPLDYKADLGAQDIDPRRFVELFRAARY